jgi:hypothetical protein
MASQPKSAAVAEYRRQIALYLEAVQIRTGWKLVKMGEMAGGLKHTTISRALKMENTLGFPALLALEAASNTSIPMALRAAAIAAQAPPSPAPTEEELQKVADDLMGKSPEYRRALLEELQRSLAKTG